MMVLNKIRTLLYGKLPEWVLLLCTCVWAVSLFWVYSGARDIHSGSYYYRMLGEAFLSGHTYLDTLPDPALAKLPDPYDSGANTPYRLQDASYYHGKFYLYFGPVPVLLVWIPIKLLTGVSVNEPVLLFALASLGTCALLWLIFLVARFQGIYDRLGFLLVALTVSFGTWLPFLLREPLFYEVAIAGAYCCTAIGALSLWAFLTRGGKYHWLTLASLFFGLAAGCRITHLANALFLAGTFYYLLRSKKMRSLPITLLCLCGPWALCITGLAIYNYVRFDSPFELGAHYMTTILGNLHAPDFDFITPERAALHLYHYLLYPLPWLPSLSFPFFMPGQHQTPWINAFHTVWYDEPAYGLITNSPFFVFFLCFLLDIRWVKRMTAETLVLTGSMLLYSLALFAFLLIYFFCTERFVVDFAPWMMTLAGFYYLNVLQYSHHRRVWMCLGIALTAYSVFTGTMAGWCSYERCL